MRPRSGCLRNAAAAVVVLAGAGVVLHHVLLAQRLAQASRGGAHTPCPASLNIPPSLSREADAAQDAIARLEGVAAAARVADRSALTATAAPWRVVLEDIGLREEDVRRRLRVGDSSGSYNSQKLRGAAEAHNAADASAFDWRQRAVDVVEENARLQRQERGIAPASGDPSSMVPPPLPPHAMPGNGGGAANDPADDTKKARPRYLFDRDRTFAESIGEYEEGAVAAGGDAGGETYMSLEDRLRRTTRKHSGSQKAGEPKAIHGPPIPEEYADIKNKTGCDVFTVPFDPADDARCLALLADPRGWKAVTPLGQDEDMRTAKFGVTFNAHPYLEAMLKVPQRLFKTEAQAEVGAFLADRIMKQNRVPPTVWTFVPVALLESAVDDDSEERELVPEFAKDSNVETFAEWMAKDVFHWNRRQQQTTTSHPMWAGEEVMGVSVQLCVADVYPLLESDLAFPLELHTDEWMNYLDPENPWPLEYAPSYIRQAELSMFDYIVGNFDRSPNKNNFVVGGCVHRRHLDECNYPRHPGAPSFVTLDNGMAFHHPNYRCPDGPNPMEKDFFCTFEKRFTGELLKMKPGDFGHELYSRMRPDLRRHFPKRLIAAADRRLEELMKRFEECATRHGRHNVLAA